MAGRSFAAQRGVSGRFAHRDSQRPSRRTASGGDHGCCRLGYQALLNRPYAGGFITEHYGRPAKGVHSLQIEINRALYLDEQTLRPNAGFAKLQADLLSMCRRLFVELPPVAVRRAAAE